jgi:hypothetical protein
MDEKSGAKVQNIDKRSMNHLTHQLKKTPPTFY